MACNPDLEVENNTYFSQTTVNSQGWHFRATLDTTASGGWISLLPDTIETGTGAYCQRGLTLPTSWTGSTGIIGVIQDSLDGTLY